MKNALTWTLSAGSVLMMLITLTSCGAWQSVKDTSSDAARAVFIAKVKQMNLVIEGRAELNCDERDVSLPVSLRVYQLKDIKTFESATYPQLLDDATSVLKADALNRLEVELAPRATIALNKPMDDSAQYVGIVAFFRDPSNNAWRLVIPKSQWKQTNPVKVSVIGNQMEREQ
jgi:type VI secretion system protein VasD